MDFADRFDPVMRRARDLAGQHATGSGPPDPLPLLSRDGALRRWFDAVLACAANPPPNAAKAAEWLADNDHVLRRAIRAVDTDMPRRFYDRLPALEGPDHAGQPRIWKVACGALEALDVQPGLGPLTSFLKAYQEQRELAIVELWALPTMLRLACLEVMIGACDALFPDLPRPSGPLRTTGWAADHDPTETIARTVTALSALAALPWKDLFDRTSLVDAALRQDPAGIYAGMDFASRDIYRKAVEDLGRGSGRVESEVVRTAIALAEEKADDPRQGHVGHWLTGSGRDALERALGYRATPGQRWRRWLLANARPVYFTTLLLFGLAALLVPGAVLWVRGVGPVAFALVIVLSLVPSGIVAVTLTHWLVTLILPPRILLKRDFEAGLPEGVKAAVAIPVILHRPEDVGPLLDHVETNWLTNPVAGLRFVVLSDLADAPAPDLPADQPILDALRAGIVRLNRRYPDHTPFVLLHRARSLDPSEGIWMGWERKRGKLSEFNDFLATGNGAAFTLREGRAEDLIGTPFVITTDADTILPPGAAHRLLGALAHPLNRAAFGPDGRVYEGYTIIQPRVEIAPEAGLRSWFTRLYTGDTAIDIYSRAVSDVYQDLFGEGIFTGKGIYDVAAFRKATAGRIPENAILSHDLFEGLLGRTALASDIVVYEDFPADYPGHARRAHRWIRGDWQLLPWLGRNVPAADGARLANRFDLTDRWRIADNLRRSLIAPGLVLLAFVGWLALPGPALLWTLLIVAAPGVYLLTDLVTGLARGRRRGKVRGTWPDLLRGQIAGQLDHTGRWALAITFMLQDAALALDAIARALWRMRVSRRGLLEWTTAARTARTPGAGRAPFAVHLREMWQAPLLAGVIGLAVLWVNPSSLPGALPLVLLWAVSPLVAVGIARPLQRETAALDAGDRRFLRGLARRTWYFFEVFAGPEDNWLPPDNFQFDPRPEIAHRTSPTNIGMLLLSTLTARDLGYVGLRDMVVRSRMVLDTMDRLERHRGHWLNWYDTRTLGALAPRYVSTVDSGNLAVSLVTLAEGHRALVGRPILTAALWSGLSDALDLMSEALRQGDWSNGQDGAGVPVIGPPDGQDRDRLRAQVDKVRAGAAALAALPQPSSAGIEALRQGDLAALGQMLVEAAAHGRERPGEAPDAPGIWLERCDHHLAMMRDEIDSLLPWLALTDAAPAGHEDLARSILALVGPDRPLGGAPARVAKARQMLAEVRPTIPDGGTGEWLDRLDAALVAGGAAQDALVHDLEGVAARAATAAYGMDFAMLYNAERRIFHIGLGLESGQLDPHYYDLLMSEARLASYFAIAKRDVPTEHWFHLGRPVSRIGGDLTALSWNGSMFEFLMPALVLGSQEGRLTGRSERGAVAVQMRHAARLGLPWGVSESSFALRDTAQVYQYQAFGVPGLGLRKGLGKDHVVAPYASGLALAVAPAEAVANLRQLAGLGLMGPYGLCEAVDFTPGRQRRGAAFTAVGSVMAHHQGMMLAAIGNHLSGNALVRHFRADRRMRAVELLLQERVPWDAPAEPVSEAESEVPELARGAPLAPLDVWEPDRRFPPDSLVLGNGRLSTTVTTAGGMATMWNGQALTRSLTHRPPEDSAAVLYLQDGDGGPIRRMGRSAGARAVFHAHMAELHQRDDDIVATLEVFVAPQDDVELRRLTLTNASDRARIIAVTSAAEVVLARPEDHERHPAFSRLFVKADYLPELHGLIYTRRPRRPATGPRDRPPVLLHRIIGDGDLPLDISYETDRRAFLGRDGTAARPAALTGSSGAGLGGTLGHSLDPVIALRGRVRLGPGMQCRIGFVTIAAGSTDSALELARRYGDGAALDWTQDAARRATAEQAGALRLDTGDLALAQRLASRLLTADPGLRPPRPLLAGDLPGQPDLWSIGLSGDLPILVLTKSDDAADPILLQLVRVHRWWQRHGLAVDLMILREGAAGYEEPIRQHLTAALREAGVIEGLGERGGIHLRSSGQISAGALAALREAAGLWIDAGALSGSGGLADALGATGDIREPVPPFVPIPGPPPPPLAPVARPTGLVFDNGLGGFAPESGDYVLHLEPGARTPQPWSNVIANDRLGAVVTEAGGGFTWGLNSGENRLTPWSNDTVSDPVTEALYLRDEETAAIWSVTPGPCGAEAACRVTHAPGATEWHKASHGLDQTLFVFVAPDAPVRLFDLRLANPGEAPRRITATFFAEWVLGAVNDIARPHVVCDYDAAHRALLARNGWTPEFAARTAFVTASQPPHSLTCNRAAFLGPEGDRARPAGLVAWDLGGQVRDVTDPCAAYQVHLDLAPGESARVVFALGQGKDHAEAQALATTWQDIAQADTARAEIARIWSRRLGAVRVSTPDPAFDLMVNRWLLYQTFASRILARSGFHQSGGAYGFRDQLQDMLAVLHVEPARVRAHLLECAAHQFHEGDVLHWWHPPSGRGVRTRCSDDMLWLPHVTACYVAATGDLAVLDESVPFLSAEELRPDEEDRYAVYRPGGEAGSLLEHCRRALERGVTTGRNGLPLMGGGDWNDGMDAVGREGRGESVWLAWFAAAAADGFADLALRAGRHDLAQHWRDRAAELRHAADAAGWDGAWYKRAFDDDGLPWGSAGSEECRIDSIAQSWSVLSAPTPAPQATRAMQSLAEHLIDPEARLVRLLTPPFDRTPRNPGYIRAYPPGVRENGGQYTHAAAWAGLAFARLGDGDSAHRVFDIINPIRRSASEAAATLYRAEPYVLPGDVLGADPHTGRAGWTWYTGAASWTLKLGVEGILGLRIVAGGVEVAPCLPGHWPRAEAVLTRDGGRIRVVIDNPGGLSGGAAVLTVDGAPWGGGPIPFPERGTTREVRGRVGPKVPGMAD